MDPLQLGLIIFTILGIFTVIAMALLISPED